MAKGCYYSTVFSREDVDKAKRELKKRSVKVVAVERRKPIFAKDKFAYKIYTDIYF